MASQTIGRRDFLKLSGIVGAAAGFGVTGLLRLKPGEVQAALAATDEFRSTTMTIEKQRKEGRHMRSQHGSP